MTKITRRQVLALAGAAGAGAVAGGAGVALALSQRSETSATPAAQPLTFDAWAKTRRAPYLIAHRGVGDVIPEHTIPGYETALGWGAQCLEISVVMSSDNVLYCLHDLTLDRTTTLTGPVQDKSSAELDRAKVRVPRLGPRWVGSRMLPMPRLDAALKAVAGRAVVCLEPKLDAAYPLMIEAAKNAGLGDAMMLKADASSPRIEMAKAEGIPVFAYLGNPQDASAKAIDELAERLDPERDALVLPAQDRGQTFDMALISRAVDTGVPVWVFPVHRRSEVALFDRLGVSGLITPNVGYINGAVKPLTTDQWTDGAIAPGELTRDPYGDGFALVWDKPGAIGLEMEDRQAFVALGQFCPIQAESYRLSLDVSFDPLPKDSWQHVSLAFGHRSDEYYEHRLGESDGYHVLLRADGTMGIYAHVEGDQNGQILSEAPSTAPLRRGLWSRLTLDVTPDLIRWSRDDGTVLEGKDDRFRGGYIHVGRSSNEGRLNLRSLTIS